MGEGIRFRRVFSRTVRLREAASTIFALVTLLPFLVLLYLLHRYDALADTEAQLGLLLALALAVLGFFVLQHMASQVSGLAKSLSVGATAEATTPVSRGASRVSALGHVEEIGQIGSAFGRLLEDLRGSTERLEDLVFKLGALNEVVELAARVTKIQDLLALVLERTMRTVRATVGSIMLVDPERRTLRIVAARGLSAAIADGYEVPLGEGIAGAVAQAGEAVVVDDIESDPRFGRPNDPKYGNGAFICMPVRVEERIIGVINLAKKSGSGSGTSVTFSPTDLQFLNTLMTHIAYSLDNARLLEEAQQSAARLTQAVQDLKAAQTRLVEGETLRAMGQMASGMAHHLNNLLSIVSGRVQLLLLHVADPGVRRALDIVKRATQDAADVVRRVLEFTAMQPVADAGTVDLNRLVHEVVELTRPRWQDQAHLRGISIETSLQLGSVPPVAGEASALREVVMNLVLNAIDALPKGGRITVRTWASGPDVYGSVSDNGTGMSDAVRHRVLEPFFTTKGPSGVGLGLSVTHAIVQRHRGDLVIDSHDGTGTVVTFHLPHADGSIAEEPRGAAAVAVPRRILLVEDEAEVGAALADTLALQGHTVVQVAGGREALECLDGGERVDLVLTDLGMPEMNGWEVARAIKDRWPGLAVGLITGWGARPEASAEQRRSVEFVIAKPYTQESLAEAIARVPLN